MRNFTIEHNFQVNGKGEVTDFDRKVYVPLPNAVPIQLKRKYTDPK